MAEIYRWDDTDAPVLSGTVGSLINLLDKVLVDGYGSKTAAGWTKEFVNANGNVAAYRSSPTGDGLGFYYRVDDDEPQSGVAHSARVDGYETMSDVDTGAGVFPDSGNTTWIRKSLTNDVTARPWLAVADDQTVYLFVWWNVTTVNADSKSIAHMLGDFLSDIPGDAYYAMVGGTQNYNYSYSYVFYPNSFTSNNSSSYCARNSAGDPGAVLSPGLATTPLLNAGQHGLPHPWYGQTLVQRIAIKEAENYTFRGYFPGVYAPMHVLPFDNFDTDPAGRLAIIFSTGGQSSQLLIDVNNFRESP